MTTSREIRLAARPHGLPQPSDFELAEVELGEPGDGELLIRNAFVSANSENNNERFYRIDARVSYALSEDWIIDGGLGYAWIDPDLGNSARSRSVFFSARYEWSKLLP